MNFKTLREQAAIVILGYPRMDKTRDVRVVKLQQNTR